MNSACSDLTGSSDNVPCRSYRCNQGPRRNRPFRLHEMIGVIWRFRATQLLKPCQPVVFVVMLLVRSSSPRETSQGHPATKQVIQAIRLQFVRTPKYVPKSYFLDCKLRPCFYSVLGECSTIDSHKASASSRKTALFSREVCSGLRSSFGTLEPRVRDLTSLTGQTMESVLESLWSSQDASST